MSGKESGGCLELVVCFVLSVVVILMIMYALDIPIKELFIGVVQLTRDLYRQLMGSVSAMVDCIDII